MKPTQLIRMANQIADFFAAYPEPEAVAGIAQHLSKFWTPDMREQLQQQLRADTAQVSPLVVKAVPLETTEQPH